MDIKQVEPGQGWLQTLNNDLTDLGNKGPLFWTDFREPGMVLLNGFQQGTDEGGARHLSVRFLKNQAGDILLTNVTGGISKANYDGQWTKFAMISDIPIPGRMYVSAADNDTLSAEVHVRVGDADRTKHTTTLEVSGHPYYGTIGGWIDFNLLY